MDLPKTISLLHRKMNKELNARLMKIGLSNAQAGLLKLLYHYDEMTQADLCKELEMDKSTVAKALARIENIGLITKTVNPDDTRSFLVSPTQKAIGMIPKTREILSNWTKDVTAGMTREEKELFMTMLQKVAEQATVICNHSRAGKGHSADI